MSSFKIERLEQFFQALNYAINSLPPADSRAIGLAADQLYIGLQIKPVDLRELKSLLNQVLKQAEYFEVLEFDQNVISQLKEIIVTLNTKTSLH